jgi:hypothetical protein
MPPPPPPQHTARQRRCLPLPLSLPCPFADVAADLRTRLPHYLDDWRDAAALPRGALAAPTAYIFLASALPALAFGAQLDAATDGQFAIPHVLVATAAAGVAQALLGGQPLLILGVAEPIVVLYGFMYALVRDDVAVGPALFRAWAAWVCAWAALLCAAFAAAGATRAVRYMTPFAGELFGALIAVLFAQTAVLGTRAEFRAGGAVNGLWGVLTLLGLPTCALALRTARTWRLLTPRLRSFLADYAPLLALLAWTGLSFALHANGLPASLPRRVKCEQPWALRGWGAPARDMARVPARARALALAPGAAIAFLFLFDHTVSAQLTQQPAGERPGLVRPPAYAYDLLLLAALTLGAGLVGIPPVNGVLPQAPMHARALHRLREAERVAHEQNGDDDNDDVAEQRVSNLAQALLVGALIPAAPAIRLLPTSVLWGYFAFMAAESLPGSSLIARTLLLFTDPALRARALAGARYAAVPFGIIAAFTLLQLGALAGVWALIAFGGVAGIAFPAAILALLPLRARALPGALGAAHVRALDPAEYEAAEESADGVEGVHADADAESADAHADTDADVDAADAAGAVGAADGDGTAAAAAGGAVNVEMQRSAVAAAVNGGDG